MKTDLVLGTVVVVWLAILFCIFYFMDLPLPDKEEENDTQ